MLLPGVSCLVPLRPPHAWASTQETTGACNMANLQAGCLDIGYGKHAVTHQNTPPYRFQKWVAGPQSDSISHSVLEKIRDGNGKHVFIRL